MVDAVVIVRPAQAGQGANDVYVYVYIPAPIAISLSDAGFGQDYFGKQFPAFDAGALSDRFAIRVLRRGRLQYTVRLLLTENVFDPSVFDPYSYE